uniref:Cytochrome P450 n=1 Tax=Leptobrachium leishanense TaxID=445787 RepID=A0A8C5M1X8_9ANUR
MDPLTILLFITVCASVLYFSIGDKNKYQNFPPGPKPLPIIGNLHLLDLKKPFDSLLKLSKKYGSIFSIQIGKQKMVVLCGYETVKDALVNQGDEFAGRPKTPIFEEIGEGHGVVFSRDENWKAMRRFTLSTLRDFGMGKKVIENKIYEESDSLVEKIRSFNGKPFENTLILNTAVANIIVSILLDRRFEYEDPTILRLLNLINENIRLIGSPMTLLYNTYPSVVRWLPGSHKAIYKVMEELKRFVKETFTFHRNHLDVNNQRNLIDAFLVKQKEEKPNPELYFHDNNLTILVIDLFAAGMETTSTTLRWGLLLMMKYPEIQKKVQDEIEKVVGSARPQAEHRKTMPYTDAVIHEIQRFANILPGNLTHATTQDVTFKGYFLPKDTPVIPLMTSVLKDRTHFERPEEFYPQHFLNSEGQFVKNEASIPFSIGRRSCAGENLAKIELFLFFTRLLQNFVFQATPGATIDLTPDYGFTIPPKDYYMCAIPRN